MTDKVYSISEIREIVAPIAQKYGVERVYLFGSYAKGTANPNSDVDLRIERGSLRGLFALSGLRIDLEEGLNKEVDLLTTGSLDKEFLNRIKNDEVLIYDIQLFQESDVNMNSNHGMTL